MFIYEPTSSNNSTRSSATLCILHSFAQNWSLHVSYCNSFLVVRWKLNAANLMQNVLRTVVLAHRKSNGVYSERSSANVCTAYRITFVCDIHKGKYVVVIVLLVSLFLTILLRNIFSDSLIYLLYQHFLKLPFFNGQQIKRTSERLGNSDAVHINIMKNKIQRNHLIIIKHWSSSTVQKCATTRNILIRNCYHTFCSAAGMYVFSWAL